MDPVSLGLLAALAGGAGGELGREAWAGLTALVRRPFRRGEDTDAVPAVSSGEAELTRLAQDPADQSSAQALSTALAVRAAVDSDFHTALVDWLRQAQAVRGDEGAVTNTISGGTQYGPVLQGRDFTGLTFTSAPTPPGPTGNGGERGGTSQ
ncbi:hypothetical protein [Streptomyces sp. DSM 15324]|uniref:hypothetical protein n=1 Tax=Streptomyces sp. DSM 15324 TaxID=1739111 RepID=UPI00074AFE00|nr:hypothetical protein [Streptomyces sp. DSM 15324]KUO11280.1 hypothetical protein AQJ58_14695 [Streptomyces sp. DSM 15324]